MASILGAIGSTLLPSVLEFGKEFIQGLAEGEKPGEAAKRAGFQTVADLGQKVLPIVPEPFETQLRDKIDEFNEKAKGKDESKKPQPTTQRQQIPPALQRSPGRLSITPAGAMMARKSLGASQLSKGGLAEAKKLGITGGRVFPTESDGPSIEFERTKTMKDKRPKQFIISDEDVEKQEKQIRSLRKKGPSSFVQSTRPRKSKKSDVKVINEIIAIIERINKVKKDKNLSKEQKTEIISKLLKLLDKKRREEDVDDEILKIIKGAFFEKSNVETILKKLKEIKKIGR